MQCWRESENFLKIWKFSKKISKIWKFSKKSKNVLKIWFFSENLKKLISMSMSMSMLMSMLLSMLMSMFLAFGKNSQIIPYFLEVSWRAKFEVAEDKLWGYCSASCRANYTRPSTYHEQVVAMIMLFFFFFVVVAFPNVCSFRPMWTSCLRSGVQSKETNFSLISTAKRCSYNRPTQRFPSQPIQPNPNPHLAQKKTDRAIWNAVKDLKEKIGTKRIIFSEKNICRTMRQFRNCIKTLQILRIKF